MVVGETSTYLPPGRDTSTYLTSSRDTNKYLQPSRETSTYLTPPSRETSSYLTPNRESSKYLQPNRDTSTYLPTSKETSTHLTPSRDKYLQPSGEAKTSLTPSRESSKYVPPSRDTSTYLPSSKENSTYVTPSRESSKYVPPSRETSTYLPPSKDSSTYLTPNRRTRPVLSPEPPRTQTQWYRRRLERDRYFTQAITPSTITSPSPPLSSTGSSGSAGTNMATTAAGNKLAQEIHEEFLTCKICLEGFKSPKCLDCLHTFCEQCIDNHVLNECSYKKYSDYREFTCPLCRKRTQLPIGGVKKLPDNFLVSSLGEVVARQKPSKFPFCDICKLVNRKHREATSKCLDCNKLLCKPCVDMHKDTKVTQSHSLFDVEIEKDIECKEHQDEVVRFYCEPCETCICVLCTFNEHKDHEITQFSDAVCKYKENIQDLLGNCKTKIDVYDRQIALLNKCEGVIKTAEQRIKDAAIQFISEIRNREKSLIEELHATYGTELMEYVNRKGEMQINLDNLKSTCNLTELVLKGKDIELLLLKRQVQEKLSVMANVELQDLPRSVGKQITFQAGTIEMGSLEDPDTPTDKQPENSGGGDTQRLTLPNMVFQRNRNIMDEVAVEKPVVKPASKSVDTQTYVTNQNNPVCRMVNRSIQAEFPDRRMDRDFSSASSNGYAHTGAMSTRGTETDTISTVEKAVNTRARGLEAGVQRATSTKDDSPPSFADSSSGLDPPDSPVQRRMRRRRERQRPVEVSVRPTTSYSGGGSSEGYEGPVLTYSSSIEENNRSLSGDATECQNDPDEEQQQQQQEAEETESKIGDNDDDDYDDDGEDDGVVEEGRHSTPTVEATATIITDGDFDQNDLDRGFTLDLDLYQTATATVTTTTTGMDGVVEDSTPVVFNASVAPTIVAEVQTPETILNFPSDSLGNMTGSFIAVETTTFNTVGTNTNTHTYQHTGTSPPRFG